MVFHEGGYEEVGVVVTLLASPPKQRAVETTLGVGLAIRAFSDLRNSTRMTDFSRIGEACKSPPETDPGEPHAIRLFVGPA